MKWVVWFDYVMQLRYEIMITFTTGQPLHFNHKTHISTEVHLETSTLKQGTLQSQTHHHKQHCSTNISEPYIGSLFYLTFFGYHFLSAYLLHYCGTPNQWGLRFSRMAQAILSTLPTSVPATDQTPSNYTTLLLLFFFILLQHPLELNQFHHNEDGGSTFH